ncbi:HAD family hydrolase [Paenibacillus sp. FSL W8-0187]|uniref:HAD family hydrolase n=1 Tax=Paenibacillus sp. FSL W8-0187 TaxID=2921710 RepID=UPI0030DD2A89
MAVRAVFFDLYETLITEFEKAKRISKRSYDYMNSLGLSEAEFKQEWGTRFERRMNGHFPDYHSVIRDILVSRSLLYPQEHVEFLYQSRVSEKKIPFNRISNEICRMLELLRKRGLKLGLISNCSEEEVISFWQSELAPYFDDVIFSYKVGVAKPNDEIYQLACDRLSVTPQDSLFIGDGGSDELRGARSAGLRPYHAYWYNTFIESEYEKIHQPLHVLDLIEISTEMESREP